MTHTPSAWTQAQRPELQASGSGASAPARHPGGLRPLCPMRLRVCGGLSLTGGRPDEGQERLLKATAQRVLDDGWRFQREQTSPRESDRGPLLCRELFGEGGEFGRVFFFFSALTADTGPPSRSNKDQLPRGSASPVGGAVSMHPRLPNPPEGMQQKYVVPLERSLSVIL